MPEYVMEDGYRMLLLECGAARRKGGNRGWCGVEVKAAVGIAKGHIRDLYAEEHLENIGLEEVVYDDDTDCWRVTIGFLRVWATAHPKTMGETWGTQRSPGLGGRREYKVVSVSDEDGALQSVEIREFA